MKAKHRSPELIFEDALSKYLRVDSEHLQTDVSERNTCARLSHFLQNQIRSEGLKNYFADAEWNRKQDGQVKTIINEQYEVIRIVPDLIVHSRGKLDYPDDNLIAVEVKKAARPTEDKDADRLRLQIMTRASLKNMYAWEGSHPEHVCGYAVGIFMEIDIDNNKLSLEFYKNGVLTRRKVREIVALTPKS